MCGFSVELGEPFERHVSNTWLDGIVRVVRLDAKFGRIRARLAGANIAMGEVIVFLESHCEVNQQWCVYSDHAAYWFAAKLDHTLAVGVGGGGIILVPFVDHESVFYELQSVKVPPTCDQHMN